MSDILIPFKPGRATRKSVRIMGIGGAGQAVLSNLQTHWEKAPELLVIDSDEAQLDQSHIPERILLTDDRLKGQGTGGDTAVGSKLAEANEGKLRALLQNTNVLILTAGLGGGTGGSVLPELCRLAREEDVITVCLVSFPFKFEGERTLQAARQSLLELKTYCGLLVNCPLDRLSDLAGGEKAPLAKALACGAEHLGQCVQSLWHFLAEPGLIKLDYSRLHAMCMHSGGIASMASVSATGKKKNENLVQELSVHPYLDKGHVLANTRGIVVLITGGSSLLIRDIEEIMAGITELLGRSAEISFGATTQTGWKDRVAVTVIASETWCDWQDPVTEKPVPEQDEQLLMPIVKKKKGSPKKPLPKQVDLDLEPAGKGRFRDVEPTLYQGQDLDIPTFRRRNIRLAGKY